MPRFFRENGLSVVFISLFALSLVGTSVVGLSEENQERAEHDEAAVSYAEYVTGPGFWQAILENFQSEWLQMATFVFFTTFLSQKGSPESKRLSGGNEVDKDSRRNRLPNSPWPVHRGGFVLKIYENSLTLALLLLFVLSWYGHAVASVAKYNEDQLAHSGRVIGLLDYLAMPRFWFETLQNWQSEWIAIATLVLLAIFLRQRGSSESKPVFAPHQQSGHS